VKTLNLLEAAKLFSNLAAGMPRAQHVALDPAAKVIKAEARRVIGTYDYGWAPLKPETIARKTTGDSPLLETGKMRDSIEYTVSGNEAQVGSNDDKAVWQELGTIHIPPRSFLAGAAAEKGRVAASAAGHIIGNYLAGGEAFGDIWHVIRHAAHDIKELGDEVLSTADDNERGNR
jgi:hypothetical protein